ncbi:site-specific integrase [uncultured Sneathiella sp.]|uniref:site-specific integrase n=1 Tax=uncultured Sneathiella sp. TaxID=879315 RepID=UPI0025948BF7|nr:site-specific integrase [uncultured Sneathiella sp.]
MSLSEDVKGYVQDAISPNTRRAYKSDLAHFEQWGGLIPATKEMVAAYLADHAGKLAIATLQRRLASISTAHGAMGLESPTASKLVQTTLRGIRKRHGKPQKQAKPLLVEDLFRIMPLLGDSVKETRDRALLLIGFAGGFRRSELVGLNVEDIETVRQGLVITITRSKTDQTGEGRKIGIPFARGAHCPVLALEAWLKLANIAAGPLFRPVTRHGESKDTRLSKEAVSRIVKQYAEVIGLDPSNYSGHSLRAGLATSAAQAGVSTLAIRRQTGHRSDAMLNRYVRQGELFTNNAANFLF